MIYLDKQQPARWHDYNILRIKAIKCLKLHKINSEEQEIRKPNQTECIYRGYTLRAGLPSYLSCRAKAGGMIFAPILPMRVGNTPTSSTTVICRRSRPHCACWRNQQERGEHGSKGDFHVELQSDGSSTVLFGETYLPTANSPKHS